MSRHHLLSAVLGLVSFCLLQPAIAQVGSDTIAFIYPVLPAHADSMADLIPDRWHVMQQVTGDLDHDGRPDVAMALEFADSMRHERQKGWSNAQPRILVVALGMDDHGFRLLTQSNSFILRADEGEGLFWPDIELAINKDTLQVGFQFTRAHWEYSFQLLENKLVCVLEVDARAFGETYEYHHIDLVKDQVHLQQGPVDKDDYDIDEVKPIPSHPPLTIERLGQPMTTEILPDVSL